MSFSIKLLGHASFKLLIDDKKIFVDPYGGDESDYDSDADLILITHKHGDHSDPNKIGLIRGDKTTIVTSTDNSTNIAGDIKALDPGQEISFGDIKVYGVPGYNKHRFRSPGEPFHPREIQTAFIVEAKGKRVYFAGDTDFIDEMKDLKDIDVAFLPIGDKYTMDPAEAMEAAIAIKPKMVVPIHWRNEDPTKFKEELAKQNPKLEVTILQHGEELVL